MLKRPEYLCSHCEDRGYERVAVGKVASGVTVYVETDIPCRECVRAYRRAMRMGREFVAQADRFLEMPKGWR